MRGYKSFESNPRPGDLRHLIEIGYTENVIAHQGVLDPDANFLQKPTSMASLAARIRSLINTAARPVTPAITPKDNS